MERQFATGLMWFRRDLRCDDHSALYHALVAARRVWCAFVFDRDILDPLPGADRRELVRVHHDQVDGEGALAGEVAQPAVAG